MSTYENSLEHMWNATNSWKLRKEMFNRDANMHSAFGNDEWADDCQLLSKMAEYLEECDG